MSPQDLSYRDVRFSNRKSRITQRNKKRKYFNPLLSGPNVLVMQKKLGCNSHSRGAVSLSHRKSKWIGNFWGHRTHGEINLNGAAHGTKYD